ncbi:MAG: transposase, partial [Bacteroidota bacterium]|nr:transposase [Bacteroidota bacterium]
MKKTLALCNRACNEISQICFEKKIWSRYAIHREMYYSLKSSYELSSQMVIRCIAKVADSYKLDKQRQRRFKRGGCIAYDSRVLSYSHQGSVVSIWTVDGRIKIPFSRICHDPQYLALMQGEADLVFKKGKFYLSQTIKVQEEEMREVDSFIGCDFGISDIVVTSDGTRHTGDWLHEYREKSGRIRSTVQSRGT